jgi:L-Ala-D/L-Glu epimerase
MRITHVEAIPYSLPYKRAARFASGTVERADDVLVRVHTDDGLVGQAEAQPRPYTYGETQASIVSTVLDWFSPALAGVDPLASELVAERISGRSGSNVARGAVELAVWDLAGKTLGVACHMLLGGFSREVSVAYMIGFDTPAVMADDAVAVNERHGINAFKLKVGRDPAIDIAACAAIRDALPTSELYVDANRGWRYQDALIAGDALIELGVSGIEEPLSLDDRVGRRRLAHRWSVPVIGDESCITLPDVVRELAGGTVGMVSIKTARTGFTMSRRILAHCVSSSVPVVLGSQYEGGAGTLATLAFAAAFSATAGRPAEVGNVLDLADDLLTEPLSIHQGRMEARDVPGVGIEIDEDKLAHYRVDAPQDRRAPVSGTA